jgi:hypothetical protein
MNGATLFSRYAFMPNRLGYCGDDDNRALLEYGASGTVDGGLHELARSFEGAYPYLQLIATTNGIADPLDFRVVHAYWIGSALLENVDMGALGESLRERFRARTDPREWRWLEPKAQRGARPHHSFHVLEIYPRIGLMRSGAAEHVLATMENCRIGWGMVESVAGAELMVKASPIRMTEGKLRLGAPELRTATRSYDGMGFLADVQPGEWVSLHWGWACSRLTDHERATLEFYTKSHLSLCNETL